jgi:hypothetical protein
MGSKAWTGLKDDGTRDPFLGMPTLHHYLRNLEVKNLPQDVQQYVDLDILKKARGALYSWLQLPLGQAIARPTNVDFGRAQLIIYAMNAIREDEMLPLGIAMSGSILAQTNKPGLKFIVFEECAINLQHSSLRLIAQEAAAQGRKKNQHCLFVSQDIGPFKDLNDIMKNCPITIVGAIVPAAIDDISVECKIPREAVAKCAESSFIPKKEEFGRNFLIATKEGHLIATDYPDFRSLYLVMNEEHQVTFKSEMKALYPNQKGRQAFEGAKILRSKSIHAKNEI